MVESVLNNLQVIPEVPESVCGVGLTHHPLTIAGEAEYPVTEASVAISVHF